MMPSPHEREASPSSQKSKENQVVGLAASAVAEVEQALDAGDLAAVVNLVAPLHAADVADLIEVVAPERRLSLIDALNNTFDPEVLTELDDPVLRGVIEQLGRAHTAVALADLDTDDAIEVLDDLDVTVQQDLLARLDQPDRAEIEEALSYPEDSAGRLMQREHMAVPAYWTVGEVIDHLRETEDLPDEFYELLVVDANYNPVGTVPLNILLRSKRPVRILDILDSNLHLITVEMDQEEVAYLFQQYDLVSAPVTDESGRLIGVIMHDDIVDVIQEEAADDILRLARAGEAGIHDPVFVITRNRFIWLMVNLITAITASLVISLFGSTIEKLVALAILMPIVASMGGNAGTQTLTVTIRALATRDITASNALRFVNKELLVAVLNGVAFALIIAVAAFLWFRDLDLAGVICAAIIINMMAAGLAGILVPLGLHRIGADPALAATVFVTTVTDVIGFFAFLGLASWLLLYYLAALLPSPDLAVSPPFIHSVITFLFRSNLGPIPSVVVFCALPK